MILSKAGLSREYANTWFKALGITLRIYAQVAGHEAIVSMVGLGLGVGVVPKIVLDSRARSGTECETRAPPLRCGIMCTQPTLKKSNH